MKTRQPSLSVAIGAALGLACTLPAAVAGPRIVDTALGQQDATVYWPDDEAPPYAGANQRQLLAADMNADGIDDLVLVHRVGSSYPTPWLGRAEVRIHFGPIAAGVNDLEYPETSADDVIIIEPTPDHYFGASLAVGDFVGGPDLDIAVSSYVWEDVPGGVPDPAGAAYVVAGPFAPGAIIDLDLEPAAVVVVGDKENALWGVVSGDVSGDGRTDLILMGNNRALVFFAPVGGPVRDLSVDIADVIVNGGSRQFFPHSLYGDGLHVAGAGDLDGDGIGDLALSARANDGPADDCVMCGAAYVFYGPLAVGTVVDLETTAADLTIYGVVPSQWDEGYGGSIHTFEIKLIHDLNGDGTDDLVLSSCSQPDPVSSRRSRLALVLLGPLARGARDLGTQPADLFIRGHRAGDLWSMAAADVSGDGHADLILGEATTTVAAGDRYRTGVADVLYGPFKAGCNFDLEATPPDVLLYGARGLDVGKNQMSQHLGAVVVAGRLSGPTSVDFAALSIGLDGPADSRPGTWQLDVVFGTPKSAFATPPVADAGGPYHSACGGGVLGIWLDGTASFDADPGDALEYAWTTTCPGTIDDPTAAATRAQFECNPCGILACEVTLTVTDRDRQSRSATTELASAGGIGVCIDLGNALRLVKSGDAVELTWEAPPEVARTFALRAESPRLTRPAVREVAAGRASLALPPARLTFVGLASTRSQ